VEHSRGTTSFVPRCSSHPEEKFFVRVRGEPGNEARELNIKTIHINKSM